MSNAVGIPLQLDNVVLAERQILVVEDDPAIRHAVCSTLLLAGYQVTEATNGLEAMKVLEDRRFDVIVLDMMLPGMSGMDILRELRGVISTPVIVVTARIRLEDRVEGLNLGADDYLVKPFDLQELLARVAALLRRSEGKITQHIEIGKIRIDRAAKSVYLDNFLVPMSRTEYEVLLLLAREPGKVVARESLERAILSGESSENIDNLVDAFIWRIRKKLGKKTIVNRRREGFCLQV
jgi:DNA-binding response OmpR family regulator